MVEGRYSTQQSPSASKITRFDVSNELRAEHSWNMLTLIANIILGLVQEWLSQFTEKRNLTLRICESCYYRFLINDGKERLPQLPNWFAKMIKTMLPPADLWIWLYPAVEEMQAKSREVSIAETFGQLEDYEAVLRTREKHIIVDASKSVASVTEEVYAAIINALALRTDRQLISFLTPKK
jgi:hypothetical protein